MCKHEQKTCPRCQSPFECKVGDVMHCQCYGINFTTDEKSFIEERYTDCLCRNCLLELKQRYTLFIPPPGIIFITGGARSGKSRYAQEMALQLSDNPVYLATARRWDDDFDKRIQRHRAERDERWISLEEEKNISGLALQGKVVVMDCVTLWLTNFFTDNKYDIESSLQQCQAEIDRLDTTTNTFIIISNEIGMGMHADTDIGRKFTDLQGWMNQYIAQKAGKVIFMVSGIPMVIR